MAVLKKWASKWGPYLVIVLLVLLSVHQCQRNRKLQINRASEKAFFEDSISYYVNRHGQQVAEKRALEGDKQTLELLLSKQVDSTRQLKKLVEKFRRIQAAGNVTTVTHIDSVFIPYQGLQTDLEHDFRISNPFYTISGRDQLEGIAIHSLSLPNTLSFAIGNKKTGLFQSEHRVEVVNSNPYVKTVGIDSYTFKTGEGIISLDAQAGYGLTIYGSTPYVGVGVGFDLWKFLKNLF